MKKSLIISAAIVAAIVLAVLAILLFNSSGSGVEFYFDGNYAVIEKTFSVKKGMAIFSVSDGAGFLVQSEAVGQGVVAPWSKVVFVTVLPPLGGEALKLSAQECKLLVPIDGELKIRVAYNPEYFNPLTDRIWTGKEKGVFKPGFLKVQIRSLADGKVAKAIPDVEALPSAKPKAKDFFPEAPELFKRGILVMRRALGAEPESEANQDFWEAKLPEKEVREIKERISGAWSVGESLFKKFKKEEKVLCYL